MYKRQGVKNVGEGPIDAIVAAREEKGKPKDIFQLIDNIDIHQMNKKALESLIKAGALDCFDGNRAAHMAVYESLMESAQSDARNTCLLYTSPVTRRLMRPAWSFPRKT